MPPDEALSIDLGSILHILVGFISRFSDPVSYRIRVKFCALCDSICHRTDTLTLRKDDLSRNRIIDIVMDWFQDPTSVRSPSSGLPAITQITQNTDPEAIQFHYELNFASLRTVVKLLERLKLQPIDNGSNDGDDSGHVVSRLFIRYSHVLLRALDICQSDPIVCRFVISVCE
jgi:neurofibromin 1